MAGVDCIITEKEKNMQRQRIEQRIDAVEAELRQQLDPAKAVLLDELMENYRHLCSIIATENRIHGFKSGLAIDLST